MQWKKYTAYQMNLRSKWTKLSAALMGLSFFIRMVYYFGLTNLALCSFLEVVFMMVLPLLLTAGYVALLSALQLNAPGLYAMIGAALCVLLGLWSFASGDALRIVLSFVIYLAAGGVLVITIAGYLPGRLLSSVLFALPLVVRFFLYDLGKIGIIAWILEISVLLMIASLFFLTRSTKEIYLEENE